MALRPERRIVRPRLIALLTARFESRLTLVTAPAGHGKSTALVDAMINNALAPLGVDVLVPATAADSDPDHFLDAVIQALGLEPLGGSDPSSVVARIADHVWSLAPDDVALMIDDAHLVDSPACADILDELVATLPKNGHLVLAGRVGPRISTTRLAALGLVTEIGPEELLLDESELSALLAKRGVDPTVGDPSPRPSTLPRLPALADLQLTMGASAGSRYLWEEVLASLDGDRLDALRRVAVPEKLDDALIAHLTGGRWTASELLENLPLVEAGEVGRWRLHDLLRAALAERSDDDLLAETARAASLFESDRGDLVAAAQLMNAAGDAEGAIGVLRRFALLPQLRPSGQDHRAMTELAGRLAPGSLVHDLLVVQSHSGSYNESWVDQVIELARRAHEVGDGELEALAIHRATQGIEHGEGGLPGDLARRIAVLAESDPFARAVAAHIASAEQIRAGDGARARAELAHFVGFPPTSRVVLVDERLCQLGRLEEVGRDLGPGDLRHLPAGWEFYIAYAMWLRGDATPEEALPIVERMMERTRSKAPRFATIAVLGVGTHIAIGAGRGDLAASWAEQAAEMDDPTLAPGIRAFALVARALVAASTGDEEPIAAMLDQVPVGKWPPIAYLMALPMLYSRCPEQREALDACGFGPAIGFAVAAGRALVDLRNHAKGEAASTLPWDRPNLLRCHLLPADLVALAAAAAERGDKRAADLIADVPDARRHLALVARSPELPGGSWARDRLPIMPGPPPPPVRLAALGPLEIHGEQAFDTERWKRVRVRELLAYLVEHRSASRAVVAAALWPELSQAKAAANLRVNLHHLVRALEPDRPEGAPSRQVVSDGDVLRLGNAVTVDVDRFDALLASARDLDRDGSPAVALDRYRQAVALVRGDYLEGFDGDWLDGTRARIEAAAAAARCRVGELILARGEPEEAMAWAIEAGRLNSLDERAGRLLMASLAATGDRIGALSAGERLNDRLHEAGLAPEPATVRAIERLRSRP